MYITNFDQFSAAQNLIIQFFHDNAATDPSTSSYTAEFYVWASWRAKEYAYAPYPTTLQGHPQYYTQATHTAPALVVEVGTVTSETFTYNPSAQTATIDITFKPYQTNIYNTPGATSNFRISFMEQYGSSVGVSVALMSEPDYDSALASTYLSTYTSTWLSSDCQNPSSAAF